MVMLTTIPDKSADSDVVDAEFSNVKEEDKKEDK